MAGKKKGKSSKKGGKKGKKGSKSAKDSGSKKSVGTSEPMAPSYVPPPPRPGERVRTNKAYRNNIYIYTCVLRNFL